MRKLRSLLGLPVVDTDTGAQIGHVHEVIVNLEQAAILAFVLNDPSWFTEPRGFAMTEVSIIGPDALMIRGGHAPQALADLLTTESSFSGALVEKEIYTDAGSVLGVLSDILFEEETGELKEYELSDGVVADLIFGRKALPLPPAQAVNQDKLIVPDSMSELLHAEAE